MIDISHIDSKNLERILSEINEKYGSSAAFSTSLSWEDQLITHSIFSQDLAIRVFTLDTGRLFPETYNLLNRTIDRYGKQIEVYFPKHESIEKMITEKGPLSFYKSIENRKECCYLRKVEPLNRALEGVKCWITGIRAEHSDSRTALQLVEKDETRNLVKVNPLLAWTLEEVKTEIRKHNIPYNSLHDKGFVSIGCQPCTRAIQEGESFRAGRWWWEDNSKKECGLHSSN